MRQDEGSTIFTRNRIIVALVLLASLSFAGLKFKAHFDADLQSAIDDAKAARAEVAFAVSKAKAAEAFSVVQDLEIADREEEIRRLRNQSAARDTVFRTIAAAAPDTCKTVIDAAEAALASKDSTIDELQGALDLSKASTDSLRGALRSLTPAAVNLSVATQKLETAAKVPLWKRILPRPGFGSTAGIDVLGKPNVTTGITFSWSF